MSWLFRQVGVKSCDDCPTTYRFRNVSRKDYYTDITGYIYNSDEITIHSDGHIIIHEGAGSDGCTPVWIVANRFYVGVPNGPKIKVTIGDNEFYEPISARAFYLHDWLLNARHKTKMPVDVIHQAFCNEINGRDWWAKEPYCKIVKRFGPQK